MNMERRQVFATCISLLTTIYMFRLLFVVFFKPAGKDFKPAHSVHESPKVMLYPMAILAILSTIAGFVQLPKLVSETQGFDNYLAPIFGILTDWWQPRNTVYRYKPSG